MPDRDIDPVQAIMLLRHDHQSLAKSITELIGDQVEIKQVLAGMNVDRAVGVERERNIHERLERMERSIDDFRKDVDKRFGNLSKPLWAAALAVITTLVAAVTTFIIKGGLM